MHRLQITAAIAAGFASVTTSLLAYAGMARNVIAAIIVLRSRHSFGRIGQGHGEGAPIELLQQIDAGIEGAAGQDEGDQQ